GGEAAHHRAAPPPAVLAHERVAQDAAQPRLEVGPRRELVERPQRPGVRLLHEVLGVRDVAGEIVGEIVERVGVGERLAPDLPNVARSLRRHALPWYSVDANAPPATSFPGNGRARRPLAWAEEDAMKIVNTLGLAALALVTLTAAAPTAPRVEIKHFAYGPTTLTVPVGATVTWVNEDEEPHTVTATGVLASA